MKALVYEGIQKVECENVSELKIQEDIDAIIKVTLIAICGANLHLVHGLANGMNHGFMLGQETMGIGKEVRGVLSHIALVGGQNIIHFC